MLKIDTIESTSEIVFRLHGRLAGPWVDELESHWRAIRATAGERSVSVDLSGVTGIDAAARYLLQLMRVRNVSLVGACLAIRVSLDDDALPTPGQNQLAP
jgi:ABC-type transporter Mla MlaB component